jgi:hypothetical protein
MGFLIVVPSAHKYSYRRPADMTGHVSSVQYSVSVPYIILTCRWKSTAKHQTTSHFLPPVNYTQLHMTSLIAFMVGHIPTFIINHELFR